MERAKKTHQLYHQLFVPFLVEFKSLLRQNLIKNYEVTQKDIELVDKVFGPDFPTLKLKSTRPKPKKVVDEEVEIPEEFIQQTKS